MAPEFPHLPYPSFLTPLKSDHEVGTLWLTVLGFFIYIIFLNIYKERLLFPFYRW